MDKSKGKSTVWKIISLVLAVALIAVSSCFVLHLKSEKAQPAPESETHEETAEVIASLSLWNDSAPAKNELINYVKAVTTEGSADFIPEEDRIAAFDLDGTLACETDPCYFDHCIYYYRVMEDPDYKDQATDFEKEVAADVKQFMDTGVSVPDSMERHGKGVASAFSGFTPEEFVDYVAEYAKTPAPGYENMTRGEAFYKPMLEVIDLLEQNGFTVYIVSGTTDSLSEVSFRLLRSISRRVRLSARMNRLSLPTRVIPTALIISLMKTISLLWAAISSSKTLI